ncbi:MAG: von Willebrand factor type A domain-containing protein, partial [Pseudomonadota bacterium]
MKTIITLLAALAILVACADEKKAEVPAKKAEAPAKKAEAPAKKAEAPVRKAEPPAPTNRNRGVDAPPTDAPPPPPVNEPSPPPAEKAEEAAAEPGLQDAPMSVRMNKEQPREVAMLSVEKSPMAALQVDVGRGDHAAAADSMDRLSAGSAGAGALGFGMGGGGAVAGPKRKLRKRADRGGRVSTTEAGKIAGQAGTVMAHDTEEYAKVDENVFKKAVDNPLSTFSIDVDTASYSNVRRFLRDGRLPPQDAVRIEELVNYFTYDYPAPTGETPFSVTTELSACPWAPKHHLLMVGLQGRKVDTSEMPKSNLVFLMDVSGSMNSPDKLPLLKSAFRLLVDNLRAEDRVAIVVYAGAAGIVLPSTTGNDKPKILEAIERLRAGGSTAGGAGIKMAYRIAKENLVEGGNNRVILATDGDFNVGASSTGALTRMVEEKRKDGIFLTVLGFGRGNTKDSRMEALADKGNGNYAYIDSVQEAKKVLVTEMGGTLLTIAKDVKIQVEFNPAKVAEYRLIGYENRILAKEDFADDTKDAGELGAGHTVTALSDIDPVAPLVGGDAAPTPAPEEMKY